MIWKLLPMISAPMPFQMALDELLFENQFQSLQQPLVRFYTSSEPWISAGYSFRDAMDFKKSAIVRENPHVPVCRRVTGGGCVLHGKDLIFALIARYESEKDPLSSVRTSYRKIHEGVRMALRSFGVESTFYSERDPLPRGSDCFRSPVSSDLCHANHKIAGGAQKRSRGVLLHQESIQMPQGISFEDLAKVVCEEIMKVLGMSGEKVALDPEIFFQAERKCRMMHEINSSLVQILGAQSHTPGVKEEHGRIR